MKESRDSSYCSQGKPSAGHWPLALEGGKSPEAAGVLPVACILEYSLLKWIRGHKSKWARGPL
jgi:hypothetical protein